MTFFSTPGADAERDDLAGDDGPSSSHDRRDRRRWIGWLLIAASLVVTTALAFAPSPYVVETPGPVYDTLGSVGAGDSETELITITGADTYPTSGSLDLLTVSVVGNPDNPASLFEVAVSWFDRSRSVQPLESIYQPGVTTEQQQEQSRNQMENSQQEAVAAALTEVGYDFVGTVSVGTVPDDSPASGSLEVGDVITSVDSEAITGLPDLRQRLDDNGTDSAATIGVERDGESLAFDITPALRDGVAVLGVGVVVDYTFPVDVDIELPNVGGPSAGMMFALGIYDKLTDGELTGGATIAGTGTIDAEGAIGPIGGIRQKLYGARDGGASLFLAPAVNCDEVAGHIPDGLDVVAVETLEDAITAVETLADGGVVDELPGCEPIES